MAIAALCLGQPDLREVGDTGLTWAAVPYCPRPTLTLRSTITSCR